MFCRNTVKWLYKLDNDFEWNCGNPIPKDLEFRDQDNEVRLVLEKDGKITVKADYAWDGCTPKFCIFDVLIGVSDGAVHAVTGRPKTYYASLVHDALYQFHGDAMPYARADADRFFLRLMKETGFAPRHVYYFFVRLFGSVAHELSAHYGKKKPIKR